MVYIMINTIANKTTGAQSGAVIAHHDQVATTPIPASLRVKNIRKQIPKILIPPFELSINGYINYFK